MSVDPVITQADGGAGFNRYVYANNNPYRYVDPDGRWASDGCSAGIGGCTVYTLDSNSDNRGAPDAPTGSRIRQQFNDKPAEAGEPSNKKNCDCRVAKAIAKFISDFFNAPSLLIDSILKSEGVDIDPALKY